MASSYLAGAAASSGMSQAKQMVSGAAAAGIKKSSINWIDFNWPSRREPLNILHFDLSELRENVSDEIYKSCKIGILWYYAILGLFCWNFISAIIVASAGDPLYPGGNIGYACLNWVVGCILGVLAWYKPYHAYVEHSNKSRHIGRAALLCAVILSCVLALGNFANVHGWATLGSDRLSSMQSTSSGVAGWWITSCIIESCGWMVSAGVAGLLLWRLQMYKPAPAFSAV